MGMLLDTYTVIMRLLLAAVLSGFIGIERGRHGRAAGLRTYILVSVGACVCAMTGGFMIEQAGTGDPSRIASGVVSGIGFLGAGMIIIKNGKVTGLHTAAALWASTTMGIACGAGFYLCAFTAAAVIYVTTVGLPSLEQSHKQNSRFYLDLSHMTKTHRVIAEIHKLFKGCHDFDLHTSKCGQCGYIGLSVNIPLRNMTGSEVVEILLSLEGVIIAMED